MPRAVEAEILFDRSKSVKLPVLTASCTLHGACMMMYKIRITQVCHPGQAFCEERAQVQGQTQAES